MELSPSQISDDSWASATNCKSNNAAPAILSEQVSLLFQRWENTAT